MAPMVHEVHEMRVFQRGVDESLMIGDEVVVTVLEVLHDSVRLGICDPSNTPEYWEETLFVEGLTIDSLDEEGSSLELVEAF